MLELVLEDFQNLGSVLFFIGFGEVYTSAPSKLVNHNTSVRVSANSLSHFWGAVNSYI